MDLYDESHWGLDLAHQDRLAQTVHLVELMKTPKSLSARMLRRADIDTGKSIVTEENEVYS